MLGIDDYVNACLKEVKESYLDTDNFGENFKEFKSLLEKIYN